MSKENIIQEKSYDFALEIIGLVKKFPKNNKGFIIGKQLLRAATSIGANVEKEVGAFTKNDYTYKTSLELKKARETNYWLRLVRDSKVINNDLDDFIYKSEESRKILTAIVKNPEVTNKFFLDSIF